MHAPQEPRKSNIGFRVVASAVVVSICFYAFVTGCTTVRTAANEQDAYLSRQLVGTWEHVAQNTSQSLIESGEFVFRPDGTFTSFAKGHRNGVAVRLDVEGKWRVANKVLIEEVTKTSLPNVIPMGQPTRDRVVSLQNGLLFTRSENGQEWQMRKR